MKRRDEIDQACERAGVYCRTYSPGDGVTRYRFFEKMSRTCECGHPFHHHNAADYNTMSAADCHSGHSEHSKIPACPCQTFRATPSNSSYFGPESGIYTALGFKEAMSFLAGRTR